MRHLIKLVLALNSLICPAQVPVLRILPFDDCSEIRETTETLFSSSEYRIYFESNTEELRLETDTNFIKVNSDTLLTKLKTGKTYIQLRDLRTNAIIVSLNIEIIKLPKLHIRIDDSKLKSDGIVKLRPLDENDNDMTDKMKLVYLTCDYYDEDNNYLYSVPIPSNEYQIRIDKKGKPTAHKIKIETLFKWIENGICVNAEDKTVMINNAR